MTYAHKGLGISHNELESVRFFASGGTVAKTLEELKHNVEFALNSEKRDEYISWAQINDETTNIDYPEIELIRTLVITVLKDEQIQSLKDQVTQLRKDPLLDGEISRLKSEMTGLKNETTFLINLNEERLRNLENECLEKDKQIAGLSQESNRVESKFKEFICDEILEGRETVNESLVFNLKLAKELRRRAQNSPKQEIRKIQYKEEDNPDDSDTPFLEDDSSKEEVVIDFSKDSNYIKSKLCGFCGEEKYYGALACTKDKKLMEKYKVRQNLTNAQAWHKVAEDYNKSIENGGIS